MWNQAGPHALYVFVDLRSGSVFGAWPEEIFPARIFAPRSADLKRMAAYPGVPVRRVAVRGSGTAFFLVKKKSLCSLESIIDNLG